MTMINRRGQHDAPIDVSEEVIVILMLTIDTYIAVERF